MRTALVCSALASLSCQPASSEPCAAYGSGNLHSYCLTVLASQLASLKSAAIVCDRAGSWSADCRTAWIDRHAAAAPQSTGELLEFCEGDDCRLLVLDTRPEGDLLLQLQVCDQAGRYADDCRGHARQRWYLSQPESSEFQRIARAPTPWDELQAEMLGSALGCGAAGDCGVTPEPRACLRAQERLHSHPWLCSSL